MASESAFTVYSTAGKYDILPAAAKTILGEYIEYGENCGKKVYRKQRVEGQEKMPDVLLFYWDTRNGEELCGWWFGDKPGGGQVWARSTGSSEGPTPPQKGWRCPVDGSIQKHVVCAVKSGTKKEVVKDSGAEVSKKRSPASDAAPAAKRPKFVDSVSMVMTSKLGDDAPASVQKLLGVYDQQPGKNHGRNTYRKKDSEEPIWLYYWDSRDGEEFSGWWLGSAVGGSMVYALAQHHNTSPAMRGWKVPHDGPVRQDMTLKVKDYEEDADMPGTVRIEKAKKLLEKVLSQTEQALTTSKAVLGREDVLEEAVQATHALMSVQLSELEAAKASLMRHGRAAKKQKAGDSVDAELSLLEERLNATLTKAGAEFDRVQEKMNAVDGSAEQ